MSRAAATLTLAALMAMPTHLLAQEDVERTVVRTIEGRATFYGPGYNGRPLGCGGIYWASDPTIVAVGPAHYGTIPCGTALRISGPAATIVAVRQDSCPGCSATTFDLSDGANALVCGWTYTCMVTVEVLR